MRGAKMDISGFIEWQGGSGSRSVDIEIERGGKIKIWVFDTDIMTGQYVNNAEEIDLFAKRDREDREKYEELRWRFSNDPVTG